jgi:hypothetical protein
MEIWTKQLKNGERKHFFKNGHLKKIREYDQKGKLKKVIY